MPGNENLPNSPSVNQSGNIDSDQQNWVKSRRLRKFAENLKDVEAVSDIVKHQEEISELQEKLKAIQTSTTILHDQILQLKEGDPTKQNSNFDRFFLKIQNRQCRSVNWKWKVEARNQWNETV